VPFKTQAGDGSGAASYWLSAQPCPGDADAKTCIQVVATPRQADPQAGKLTLTSAGVKNCTGAAAASDFKLCWP
jgi:type IV pilus assembly protein PilE